MKRINKKMLACLAVICIMCSIFSGCGSSTLKITVLNNLGYDIYELYISPDDEAEFGDDALKAVLEDGGSVEMDLTELKDKASFDILAVDEDGDYYEFYGIVFSDAATVEIYDKSGSYYVDVIPKKGDTASYEGEFYYGDYDDSDYVDDDSLYDLIDYWYYDGDLDEGYIVFYSDYTCDLVEDGEVIELDYDWDGETVYIYYEDEYIEMWFEDYDTLFGLDMDDYEVGPFIRESAC